MRIASVVGTRPQLIKAAALIPALVRSHRHVFIDTGQHWDDDMAGRFFVELGLPRPDFQLEVGAGTHGEQTAAILTRLEPVLADVRPDVVLVFGDTNSTLGAALVAAKLGLPFGHVEAGLRSFDRSMPEEINRIVADHLAAWLFAPTATAVDNLANEGLAARTLLVGDLMRDLAALTVPSAADPAALAGLSGPDGHPLLPGRYLFATVHRAENRPVRAVREWAQLLRSVARPDRPILLALHPGTREAVRAARADLGPNVAVVPPQGYRTTIALQLHAAAVITDSGGVQREASWLDVPCLVLRGTTEWVEAVEAPARRTVVVGRAAEVAVSELGRLAPLDDAPRQAELRAANVTLEPGGAADAIARALSTAPGRAEA